MRPAVDMAAGAAPYVCALVLAEEAGTVRLAEEIAANARPGDLVLLQGDLGAGKTTLARAIIRAVTEDEALEVPSPTFTLAQSYDAPRLSVHHFDLYRVSAPEELDELGLDDALAGGLVLVEWPERAGGVWPDNRLEVMLMLDPATPERRQARLAGHGEWAVRLERMDAGRRFLEAVGFADWRRRHLKGDASTRRYERLSKDSRSVILMDAPAAPDPGAGAVPYSRVAHLAESVVPFVAVCRMLRAQGLSAPDVHVADLDAGFLLLEDLSCEGLIDSRRRPIRTRYETAIDLVAHLHTLPLPDVAEAAPGRLHRLPRYDMSAFMAEAMLLLDWFAPHVLGERLPADAEAEFRELWQTLLEPLLAVEHRSWVLRDFHSPNLMWLGDRRGLARVGLLDFQDAVIGPAAYDVASLVMDARVDVPRTLQETLSERYASARRRVDPAFDAEAFLAEVALMAAQRNTKILGIFARLHRRDGKPAYLAHIPRISDYLEFALGHPALASLKAWYDAHLPGAVRLGQQDDGRGR